MVKKMTKKAIFWLFFLGFCMMPSLWSQVSVTSSAGRTAEDVVRSMLVGDGVSVSNVKFNNYTTVLDATTGGQLGFFTNNTATFPTLGFSSGLIIATGDIQNALGPNDDSGSEISISNSMTCPELQALVSDELYYPAVLEFDFLTTSDQVTFNYMFASEEYPEFVGMGYNDVFGFFVTDLTTNQTTNVARIPNTTLPVSIDNVNDYSYSQYYHDTEYSSYIQYDACVGPLAATFSVVPCRLYHMKLAVSNAGDNLYGSAVFLEGQSFTANGTETTIVYDVESLPVVVQDCNTATVTFNISQPQNSPTVIPLTYSGTAINGTDVQTLPSSVTIPAGQTSVTINIVAIGAYTPDTLILNIYYESSICEEGNTISVMVCKNQGIEISAQNVYFCEPVDSLHVQLVAGACGEVEWSPSDMLSDPGSLNTGFNTEYLTPTTFTVTAHDIFHCTSSTVTFEYAHGASFDDTIRATICDGAVYNQYGFNESETGTYTHYGQTSFGCDSSMTLILESFSADASIEVGGTDLCDDGFVELTAVTSNTDFHWSNGSTDMVLTVTHPGNYTLDASDGPCHAHDMVTIAPCPDEEIYIPNAITPTNVDGINDYFQIYIPSSLEIVEFEIAIYDRWGKLVFKSDEPNFRWNGKVNGKFLPSSTVLTYRIMMMSKWHPKKIYKGTLTIL